MTLNDAALPVASRRTRMTEEEGELSAVDAVRRFVFVARQRRDQAP